MARATTAACRWATSRLRVPPGRSTPRIVASAAAGSSTTSSTPWQSTTSAPSTRPASPSTSPWTPVTWTPISRARRSSAARASGLGSTTVTRWPSSATRTAKPPVPPPMSSTLQALPARAPGAARPRPRRCGWHLGARWQTCEPTLVAAPSSRAPGAAVPQLAGHLLGVLAGRLDVGVRRHLEAAGVHQHPAAHRSAPLVSSPRLAITGRTGSGGPARRSMLAAEALGHHGRRHARRRAARARAARAAPRRRWRAARPRGSRCAAARRAPPAARSGTPSRRRGPARPRRTSRRPGRWRRRGSGRSTRRPDRIGGVWVATLTPATSSSDLLRRRSRSVLRVTPSSSRNRS